MRAASRSVTWLRNRDTACRRAHDASGSSSMIWLLARKLPPPIPRQSWKTVYEPVTTEGEL